MPHRTQIRFNTLIAGQKPENIVNSQVACPFCDRASLEGILASDGPLIWLRNKYPVLEDALQTVIIETETCQSDLSEYPPDQLNRVVRFAVTKWRELEQSGDFSSVILYKNHGPASGGTIRHPHSQIIGLHNIDYREHVRPFHFEGLPIHHSEGALLSLSTRPRAGLYEFNVSLSEPDALEPLAKYLQISTHYLLHHFHRHCHSYNIFFYDLQGHVYAKIVPRLITSPLFVGYSIPQVSTRLEDVVRTMQIHYFS